MNAKMLSLKCKVCKFPVVFTICNGLIGEEKPYACWDYWYYCSNKCCVNHGGEGVFQDNPNWTE